MLKQILEDMYIDKELLKLLDEDQKAILFQELRREQLRRWEKREAEADKRERAIPPKRSPAKVGFLKAKNGEDWVWVCGEGPGDLPYSELVKKNDRERKLRKANSTGLLADKVRDSIDGVGACPSPRDTTKLIEAEWQEREKKAKEMDKKRRNSFHRLSGDHSTDIEKILETLPVEKKTNISRRLSQRKQSISLSRRASMGKAQDPRERPVVEFVSVESVRGTRPANKALVCEWFRTIERPKGVGLDPNGTVFDWFHGIIDRRTTEKLLLPMPEGSHLVRVSDKMWGYVLSVKITSGVVKHFRIDASQGKYQMFETPDEPSFSSLFELLLYYRINASGEVLKEPCGQVDPLHPDFSELMEDDEEVSYM